MAIVFLRNRTCARRQFCNFADQSDHRLSATEVGALLGVSAQTVRRASRDGRLPRPKRLYRGGSEFWTRTQIERRLAKNRRLAESP